MPFPRVLVKNAERRLAQVDSTLFIFNDLGGTFANDLKHCHFHVWKAVRDYCKLDLTWNV